MAVAAPNLADMLSTTTAVSAVLSALAYAVLAAAGVVQWKRARSVATAMVAIGFAMVLLDQLVELIRYLQIGALLRGHPSDTLYVVYHRAFIQYISLLGLWFAAVGLMWRSLRFPGR